MSDFLLGCPLCSKCLRVSMYSSPIDSFSCPKCGQLVGLSAGLDSLEIRAAKIEKKDSGVDPLLTMLLDAVAYGAYYQELVVRDSGMAVAKESSEAILKDWKVKKQLEDWLKNYRERNNE